MNEEEQRRVVEGLMLIVNDALCGAMRTHSEKYFSIIEKVIALAKDLEYFPEESKQYLGKCHTMAFCATIP